MPKVFSSKPINEILTSSFLVHGINSIGHIGIIYFDQEEINRGMMLFQMLLASAGCFYSPASTTLPFIAYRIMIKVLEPEYRLNVSGVWLVVCSLFGGFLWAITFYKKLSVFRLIRASSRKLLATSTELLFTGLFSNCPPHSNIHIAFPIFGNYYEIISYYITFAAFWAYVFLGTWQEFSYRFSVCPLCRRDEIFTNSALVCLILGMYIGLLTVCFVCSIQTSISLGQTLSLELRNIKIELDILKKSKMNNDCEKLCDIAEKFGVILKFCHALRHDCNFNYQETVPAATNHFSECIKEYLSRNFSRDSSFTIEYKFYFMRMRHVHEDLILASAYPPWDDDLQNKIESLINRR